jgi:hypothetical protein
VQPTMREWCITHRAQYLLRTRRSLKRWTKANGWKKIERHMQHDHGRVVKLKSSPAHWWSAIEDVLLMFLTYWNQIIKGFLECNVPFMLTNDRELLLELHSIIHPIWHIQRVAQTTKGLVSFQVYVLLMHAY